MVCALRRRRSTSSPEKANRRFAAVTQVGNGVPMAAHRSSVGLPSDRNGSRDITRRHPRRCTKQARLLKANPQTFFIPISSSHGCHMRPSPGHAVMGETRRHSGPRLHAVRHGRARPVHSFTLDSRIVAISLAASRRVRAIAERVTRPNQTQPASGSLSQ